MDKKWWYGSSDGKHGIISQDKGDLPENCNPAPVHRVPTDEEVKKFEDYGLYIYVHRESEGR